MALIICSDLQIERVVGYMKYELVKKESTGAGECINSLSYLEPLSLLRFRAGCPQPQGGEGRGSYGGIQVLDELYGKEKSALLRNFDPKLVCGV